MEDLLFLPFPLFFFAKKSTDSFSHAVYFSGLAGFFPSPKGHELTYFFFSMIGGV